MINIQIVKPLPGLEKFIDCYSFCKGELNLTHMRVIANSCTTLFIYFNGSKHNGQFNNETIQIPRGIISPFSLRKDALWTIQAGTGKITECLTIMFTHIGFHRLFGIPMKELYGAIYDLSDVVLPGFPEVIMRIEDARNTLERTEVLNKYFKKQFNCLDNQDSRYIYIQRILVYLRQQKGKLNVKSLCEHTCMTERSLENWFKTYIGTSPVEFIHIVRFHALLQEIYNNNSNVDWQNIVRDYKYYDQSHFINVFKDATSVTPEYFLKNKKSKLFLASNGSGCLFFSDTDNSKLLMENA
jgi:AraC-like DNA-binding protein